MKAFWRDEELNSAEWHLLDALLSAHYESCFRDNASSVAVKIAADASGDFGKAIVAGISTMGGKHAPLEETIRFLSLEYSLCQVAEVLKRGQKIPGWGGTYQDGAIDPIWIEVDRLIERYQPTMHRKLEAITHQLKQHGKLLYPNPSAYTACVAIALGVPVELAPYLFIYGRIDGWAEIAAKHLRKK
jgi:citrate synthase